VSLKKLGRYELTRVLGKGAMGVVYEGRDPNLDRRVAIKTVKVENLSEEAAAEYEHRFRTEARSAARLQHPNIVSVYDSDRDGDTAFLVMEYIQGDDLKHHLDRGVRYSLEQSLKMVRDLLSALDYAHKQGIVHRDIKPANLLIEPGGRVKLTDFGVARIQDSSESTRTQGSMVGTLKYMSPEQVQGQKIDTRADLFSVGVVLYQLLTDKRPFDGDNDFSIIHQIIGHSPPPPSSFNARLPAAIDAVVARALAKNRDERFATARDFAVALQSAIRRAEDQTVVPPADPTRSPDRAPTGSRAGITAPGGLSNPGSLTSPGGVTSPTSISTITQEAELVYWKDIKDSSDPEELQGFLNKFPAGIYADLARRRLRKLTGAFDSTQFGSTTGMGAQAQDLEATRLRTDASRPLAAAKDPTSPSVPATSSTPSGSTFTATQPVASPTPASAASQAAARDWTATVVEPRAQPQPEATRPVHPPHAEPVEPVPPAVVAARGEAGSPPQARRKVPVAAFAGVGLLALAGVVAALVGGRGQDKAAEGAAPQAAASAPAKADRPATAATPPPAPADATPPAVVAAAAAPPVAAASKPTPNAAASAPRKPASRPAKMIPPPELARQPAPPSAIAAAEPARPATASSAAPGFAQVEACKERVFLSRELCLAEHCDKPGARNHPLCVKRREDARLREESKIRQ
jgi:serine/threonine-protein kinase